MKHTDVRPVFTGRVHIPEGELKARLQRDEAADQKAERERQARERAAKREAKRQKRNDDWSPQRVDVLQVTEGLATLTQEARRGHAGPKVNVVLGVGEASNRTLRFTLNEEQAYDLADALDEYIEEMESQGIWEGWEKD